MTDRTWTTAAAPVDLLTGEAYRRFINLFFGCLALATLLLGLLTAKFYRSWTVADWLINYGGGFVRRGLMGEIALHLGRWLHLSPVTVVVAVYLTAYGVIFVCLRQLALQVPSQWWCLALLLSPATLSYQVLDVTGGSRKEVLYFAALALLVIWLRAASPPSWQVTVYLTLTLGLVTFSHEPLVFYSLYFFAALLLSGRGMGQALREFALPCMVVVAAGYLSAQHHGDAATAARICSSLGRTLQPQGKDVCEGGAIGFLAVTAETARQRTWTRVWGDLYLIVYPLATLLALIPIVLGARSLARRGFRMEIRALWRVAGLSFAASFPLFIYAEDWGRWIYLHSFSLAILILALQVRAGASFPTVQAALPALSRKERRVAWCTLLAYATLWSLPHVPSRTLPFGYLGLAHYLSLYL